MQTTTTYPDQYLHIEELRSGQTYIVPLSARHKLCLDTRVKEWIKNEFGGEYRLDGKITRRLEGDYYAKLMTAGRAPDSVSWDGGGFYLTNNF